MIIEALIVGISIVVAAICIVHCIEDAHAGIRSSLHELLEKEEW